MLMLTAQRKVKEKSSFWPLARSPEITGVGMGWERRKRFSPLTSI